jgi:hypothetical protein
VTLGNKPVTSHAPAWNFDMSTAPAGRKLLALNPGHVACFALITNNNRADFRAWCALPKIPKEMK